MTLDYVRKRLKLCSSNRDCYVKDSTCQTAYNFKPNGSVTELHVCVSNSVYLFTSTLVLGSALALYLYPHAINGVLSSESVHKLRSSTALLPLYGIGLAIMALMGILVYAVPSAMNFLSHFPESSRGILVRFINIYG